MYYNNKKLVLSIFWIILGATLVVLSVLEILKSSVYAGMGAGLVVIGILQVIRNLRYRKDAEYKEKIDVEFSDERGKFLRMKSWSLTGYITIITASVGSVVALILGQHTIQLVLSYCVCFMLVVFWITYIVVSRKY
jgi:uncharacterized membrane protein